MKRVYVAGAYSADNIIKVQANMRRGLALSVKVLQAGFAPFCPWLDFQFGLIDAITLQQYYDYSLAWLEASDALLVVQEGWKDSKGTLNEIKVAGDLNIPVFHDFDEMVDYFQIRKKALQAAGSKTSVEQETDVVMDVVSKSLIKVMQNGSRKHPPFSWREESEDEHLRKAARHILTYQLIRDNQQDPTGEPHLDNALTRLAMAMGLKKG